MLTVVINIRNNVPPHKLQGKDFFSQKIWFASYYYYLCINDYPSRRSAKRIYYMTRNKSKGLFSALLAILTVTISLAGCIEKEDGTEIPEGADVTTIKGRVITSDNKPIAGMPLKVIFTKTSTTSYYTLIRDKALTSTDSEGNFTLYFYMTDDEISDERDRYVKYYEIVAESTKLDPEMYVVDKDINEMVDVERGQTITTSCYIPKRRRMNVELKGFSNTGGQANFYVYAIMPYGFERGTSWSSAYNPDFPSKKYGTYGSFIGRYTATDDNTVFTDIAFPLNDSCIVNIVKRDATGVTKETKEKLFITSDQPASLTYTY